MAMTMTRPACRWTRCARNCRCLRCSIHAAGQLGHHVGLRLQRLHLLQVLASVADQMKNFAVIYLVDISEVGRSHTRLPWRGVSARVQSSPAPPHNLTTQAARCRTSTPCTSCTTPAQSCFSSGIRCAPAVGCARAQCGPTSSAGALSYACARAAHHDRLGHRQQQQGATESAGRGCVAHCLPAEAETQGVCCR